MHNPINKMKNKRERERDRNNYSLRGITKNKNLEEEEKIFSGQPP
jgi:hypothetical protein